MQTFLPQLIEYFGQWKPVPPELRSYITAHVHYRHLHPAEILLQRGQVCPAVYFVARGYIRWGEQEQPYFYTLPGQMLIKKSYDERRPAVHSLQAVPSTDLLYMLYDEVQLMAREYDIIHYYGRVARSEQFDRMGHLYQLGKIRDAKERYHAVRAFLGEAADLYPDIVQDISHVSRASYFRAKKEDRKKGK